MNITLPTRVIRDIIADILYERGNYLDDASDELADTELKECGVTLQYSAEVGWTACGTRALSDDVRDGLISIEESIEILSYQEMKILKERCLSWTQEQIKGKSSI